MKLGSRRAERLQARIKAGQHGTHVVKCIGSSLGKVALKPSMSACRRAWQRRATRRARSRGSPWRRPAGRLQDPCPPNPAQRPPRPRPRCRCVALHSHTLQACRPLQPHAAEPDSRMACRFEAEPGMLGTRRAWWALRQSEQADVPCRHALATVLPKLDRDALVLIVGVAARGAPRSMHVRACEHTCDSHLHLQPSYGCAVAGQERVHGGRVQLGQRRASGRAGPGPAQTHARRLCGQGARALSALKWSLQGVCCMGCMQRPGGGRVH